MRRVLTVLLLCLSSAAWAQHGVPWSGIDGSASPGIGSPQYPTLLSGYTVRPPWKVAGVDYYVGAPQVPSNGPVSSAGSITGGFSTFLAANSGSANTTTHVISFTNTAAITIDNWDFTSDGGWFLSFTGTGDITLTNNKIGGTNMPNGVTGQATSFGLAVVLGINSVKNLTAKYNTFDGGVTSSGMALNESFCFRVNNFQASGTFVFQYNWIKNVNQSSIELPNPPAGAATSNISFNFFDDTKPGYSIDSNGATGATISNITNSGGLILITLSGAPVGTGESIATGQVVQINGVQGVPAANSTPGSPWTITNVSSSSFTLNGSTFSGTYTSGTGAWANATPNGQTFNHMHYLGQGPNNATIQFNTSQQLSPDGAEGFQLYAYNGNTTTTSAISSVGTNTITISSTSGWTNGQNVTDVSVPNALLNGSSPGVTVTNIVGSAITLSSPIASQIGNGDSVSSYYPMVSPNFQYNTMIAKKNGGSTTATTLIHGSGHGGGGEPNTIMGPSVVMNNYFDPTGVLNSSMFYQGSGTLPGNTNLWTGWTFGGNFDMTNGKTVNSDNSEH